MKSLSGAAAAEAEAAEAEAAEATINSLVKRRTVNYHCELSCWGSQFATIEPAYSLMPYAGRTTKSTSG